MNFRLKDWLWGFIGGILFMGIIGDARCESIASMPNKGGGKIILTNDPCKHEGKTYPNLNRAYNYTSEGYGSEGCYTVEDDTVVVLWNVSGSSQKMRYPLDNFTLTKKSTKYGT